MSDVEIPKKLEGWAERATDDIMDRSCAGNANTIREDIRLNLETAIKLAVVAEREKGGPIPMRLRCPQCSTLHIDEGEFATRPHKTHTCQSCGEHFQPALVPTVGVKFLPGCESKKG